jgi:hypothetical protein
MSLATAMVQIACGIDQHFYELKRLWDPEAKPPDTEAVMGRYWVDLVIGSIFNGLVYLICLLYVFSKL